MSSRIVDLTSDDLPPGWIKKQSKSRPNQSYYFNTATKTSQWTLPVPSSDEQRKRLTRREPVESATYNGKNDGISIRSKQIKKRQPKTPAQDRLQNLNAEFKNAASAKHNSRNVADQRKNLTPVESLAIKRRIASERVNGTGKTKVSVDANKSKEHKFRSINDSANELHQVAIKYHQSTINPHTPYKNDGNKTKLTDEIPSLFPSRTPGQDRLKRLRDSLNPICENKPESESSQKALSVIQSEFGIALGSSSDRYNQNASIVDEYEPMEWESCDIFEEIENNVRNEIIHPYIVPDTNVFLDELSCIRDAIVKDTKYNVLVPFVVLQELDRLKSRPDDSRISHLASRAIRFIYQELKSKNHRLQGQKATEDRRYLIDVNNADDKILNCCLQMVDQSRETILVTNDINLCNKAISSGITTMTSEEYKAKHN